MSRKSRYDNDVGASVSVALAEAKMTQPDLAKAMGVSTAYVNKIVTGKQKPSAAWIDLVANATGASEERRILMHRAAAKAHGFRLDLTKK